MRRASGLDHKRTCSTLFLRCEIYLPRRVQCSIKARCPSLACFEWDRQEPQPIAALIRPSDRAKGCENRSISGSDGTVVVQSRPCRWPARRSAQRIRASKAPLERRRRRLRPASHDAPQQVWGVGTQGFTELGKLAHLKPALARLELTDVAGRSLNQLRKLAL